MGNTAKVKDVMTVANSVLDDALARFDERGYTVLDIWPAEPDEVGAVSAGHPGLIRWAESQTESYWTTIIFEMAVEKDDLLDAMFYDLNF